MITAEMIEALSSAAADAEVYGERVERALTGMWIAARDGNINDLEDSYTAAKYEAFHLHATMLAVKDAMHRYEERQPKGGKP